MYNFALTFSATPTNTLPRHGINNNQLTEQDLVNRNITYNAAINSCSNSELALSSSSIRDIPCTLQNCDLNTSCSLIRSSSSLSSNGGGIVGASGCYSAPSTMKINQQNQTSNQSLAQILATNQSTQNLYEQYIDCMSTGAVSQTILPPPLFDTNCSTGNYNQCYEIQNHPGNYCTLSAIEMPKMSSMSSKRLHRTIPKHFTMSSPSSSAILAGEMNLQQQHQQQHGIGIRNSENKKPSCQCPVQHVPMTYMQFPSVQQTPSLVQQPMQELQPAPQQFAQPQRHQHSIYMSGSKKHNVIKSTTFPSAMNASSGPKIQTIANAELMGMGVEVIQSTHADMSGNHISSGGSGTLRRSHKSSLSGNNNAMPTTPNKKSIATISVANPVQQSTAGSTPGYYTPKMELKHQPPLPQQQQQIHSILKNKNHSGCHVNVISVTEGGGEQNPILPPKMYKTSSSSSSSSKFSTTPTSSGPPTPSSSKQIHTITRPNELTTSSSQFSLLSINGGGSQKYQQQSPQQYQHQQPTQLRTNIQVSCETLSTRTSIKFPLCRLQGTLYNTKTLPRGTHGCDGEKMRSHREQQQQSTSNYSTNTLPKNHHQQQPASQQIYGKVANPSRSVLTEVVNKVPSVIMLPIPQQQMMKNVTITPSNSLTKMSSSTKSSLSNENSEMEAGSACHSQNSTLKRTKSKKEVINANEKLISSKGSVSSAVTIIHERIRCDSASGRCIDKPLPILTTSTNCTNPKEHFLPSEASLDDDYLSECENCKTAGTGSRYYLDDEELDELPLQETMTLQRKLMNESDENDQQNYYRVSSTLPTNTNKKIP